MVMKSIVWIFGCSLMFAGTLMLGICLQSCKIKKEMHRSSIVDSVRMDAYIRKNDVNLFTNLLEQNQENLRIDVKYYRPLPNNISQTNKVYLTKHIQVARDKQSNVTELSSTHETDEEESLYKINTHIENDEYYENRQERPFWKYGLVLFFLWGIWIYCRSK